MLSSRNLWTWSTTATDIYDKMDRFLRLPRGELARLAGSQRKAELKRELGEAPVPLFREVRDLILRKCHPDRERHVRAIFEAQPFGELERLITQRLLDVLTAVATEELGNEYWLRMVADLSGRSFEETSCSRAFLKRLRFDGRRPTPLYYYREFQSRRDPLHLRAL
jgi:hypothetical protein